MIVSPEEKCDLTKRHIPISLLLGRAPTKKLHRNPGLFDMKCMKTQSDMKLHKVRTRQELRSILDII